MKELLEKTPKIGYLFGGLLAISLLVMLARRKTHDISSSDTRPINQPERKQSLHRQVNRVVKPEF